MKRFDVSELVEASEREPIEVRKLKKRINELLRMLEEGQTLELTNKDKLIVRVRQVSESKQSTEQRDVAAWNELKRIASELAPYWADKNVDSVDIVHDVRRDL